MSYNNVFGGNLVQVADPSYLAINLNQNITLSWPSQFQDTNQVVAKIMDITPDQAGRTITLPDATLVSVGTDFLAVNLADTASFNILKNDSSLLATITHGEAVYFYLTNNTTAAGTWRIIPFGGGFAAVTSVGAATEEGSVDERNLGITGSPVTGAGTFEFSFKGDLGQLISFGNNTGIAVRTGGDVDDESWSLRQVVIEDNGNLIVENGDGVLGNIKLDLREQLGLPRNQITSIRVGNIGLGIDADGVTANIISTFQTDQNLLLKPNGTGEVRTEKNFGAQSGSKVKFLSADNTNYLSLSGTQVGFTLNVNWAAEAPTPNQILQYKEVGVTNQPTFGWANVPTIADETTVNGVAKFSDEAGSLVSTAVLIDGTNNIISPSTITAAAFISGNLQIQNNRTIGTTANDLNISPNTNLNLNSNVYIGANNGGLDNRRTLYFFSSLNNTVGLAPPAAGDIAASIKFVLPAVIPAQTGTPAIDQNYVLKCNVTGAGVGTLSLTDLTAGTGTGISSEISSRADVTAGTERNRPVTPVNMGFHNGMVKAWCVFTANVTPIVLVGAYNANVVRAGVGHYTVTFGTTDMTAATYSVVMGYAAAGVIILRYVITNAHGFDIFAVDATNAAVDPTTISFQVCGFQ